MGSREFCRSQSQLVPGEGRVHPEQVASSSQAPTLMAEDAMQDSNRPHRGSSAPTECCFEFFSRRLRTNNVVSYQFTDDSCAKKAVLFTMKRASSVVCADPSLLWVKNIIQAKEWTHIKKGNSSEPAVIN
uniref:C-C motif chemokine n=1 Tax=Sparus aurata TaxID=8175 RepID=A0A671WZE6_SPAAU